VRQGKFRADLYYLLGTFTIGLPPLRARRDDIPLLVDHFVKQLGRIGRAFGASVARASQEALELLTAYDWPGNLDELQCVIRRALAETGGALVVSDFLRKTLRQCDVAAPAGQGSMHGENGSLSSGRSFLAQRLQAGTHSLYADALEAMERQVLQAALDHTGGNQAQAAKILGITRGHLRKKIRLLGLSLSGADCSASGAPPPETAPVLSK
jgi:two-component system nitrogen regulation response regulator GlnG